MQARRNSLPIDPRKDLDNLFWRLILGSWTYGELDCLQSLAKDAEGWAS